MTSRNAEPYRILLLISFLGGFQIMVLEVCGFRVLQTNLGSSVIVTGTLLTLVMVLLSGGYFCGGRLVRIGLRPLLGLLLAGAVYTQLCDVLGAELLADWSLSLRDQLYGHPFLDSGLPAALLSLALYGPPVFLTSMLSPFLIHLHTRSGGDAGRQSGFFMSLSTVGSIAGTLLASYWLIPMFGVVDTVTWSNTLFAACLALAYLRAGPPTVAAVPVLAIPLALYASSWLPPLPATTEGEVVYQADSYYGNIRIVAARDPAGRPLLEYQPSRVYTHSVLYPQEPLRELPGLQYLVTPMANPPRRILILGSAAGGLIRQIDQVFPQAQVTGVDIDPAIHRVAREQFGVDAARTRLVAQDARVFLEQDGEAYDLVVVDLFAGEFIPPHCISLEFFRLVKRRLAAGGAVFINSNMNDIPAELTPEAEPFRPVRHLHATLLAAGFPVLFENRFFHGLYAYPEPLPEARFIAALRARLHDPAAPPALRAAAGIAAFTSAEVPPGRRRYRPYTDRWMPAPLVELKTNEAWIYRALASERTPRGDATAERVLRRLLEEAAASGYPAALRDPAALATSLAPLPALNQAGAARYLRFSPEAEAPPESNASANARIVAGYAELYRHAYANDYERLEPTLAALEAELFPPAEAAASAEPAGTAPRPL